MRGGGRLLALSSSVFGYCKKEYKHGAFTLAEVLVTLGIIGVVAAMTMPTLIGNTKPKELEAQFKKAHSMLSQATVSVVEEKVSGLIKLLPHIMGQIMQMHLRFLMHFTRR